MTRLAEDYIDYSSPPDISLRLAYRRCCNSLRVEGLSAKSAKRERPAGPLDGVPTRQ